MCDGRPISSSLYGSGSCQVVPSGATLQEPIYCNTQTMTVTYTWEDATGVERVSTKTIICPHECTKCAKYPSTYGTCPTGYRKNTSTGCCDRNDLAGGNCTPPPSGRLPIAEECTDFSFSCDPTYEVWSQTWCMCVCRSSSPVLIDTQGDGFRLTDPEGGVRFDLDSDGLSERLSWTEAGTDDAWLALDRDGDGAVTTGAELFGNFTPQPEPPTGEEPNGFLALAEFDRVGQGGNSDGVIDNGDAVFSSLRLWRDANHDGLSQPEELHTLLSLDVLRLHLDYKESERSDEHGNRFKYRAKVDDAKGAKVNRWAWDVFLVARE
jgi:hypothetical protein